MTSFIKLTLWQMYKNAPQKFVNPEFDEPRQYQGNSEGEIIINRDMIISLHRASRGAVNWPEGAAYGDKAPDPVREWFTEVTVAVRHEEAALEYTVFETPEEILKMRSL